MKKTLSLVLALLMVLSLCACGSSYAKTAESTAEAPAAAYAVEGAYSNYDYEEAEEEAAYGGFAADNAAAASGTAEKPQENTAADINPDKIIYSANARLETTAFDETITRLNELISSCGGFVESSSISGANYYSVSHNQRVNRSANYTIRIPSASFSDIMSSLSTLGNVPYTNTYTDNITSQYYDVQARLNAYKTQETRLLEMMEIAETVEDIITIEDRLTELRYEIESLQSTLNNWDRKVSFSTIYLDVEEVSEYTEIPTVTETYGEKLIRAAKNGLEGIANFFKDFLVWLLEALPTLIIIAAVVWIVIAVIRGGKKRRARRAEKREQRKAEKAAKKAQKTVAPVESDSAEKEDKAE